MQGPPTTLTATTQMCGSAQQKKEFTFDRHILRRSRALVFGLFVSAPEAAAGDKENDDGRVDGIDDDDHLQGQLLHRFVPTWFTSRRD